MRIRSLRLKNFRRHADTHVEFPDGVTALIGRNGAGKSSLLEGIAFALFGGDGLRTGKALVRREGAPPGDHVKATLELELGGQALTIQRELRGKALAPNATLVIDGALIVPSGAGSSEAVTQQVAKRLGMGADAFFTTVVARQGELARLANESPADRKRMILRMVGVDQIDLAIEGAREQRRNQQAALDALRRVAQDPAAAEARVLELQAVLAAAQQRLQQAQVAWTTAQATVATAARALADLEAAAEARRALVAQHGAAEHHVRQAQGTLTRAQDDLQLALAAQQAAEAVRPNALRLAGLRAHLQEAQHALSLARQRAIQEQSLARLEADLAAAQKAMPAAPVVEEADGEQAEVDLRMAESDVRAARERLAVARRDLEVAHERRHRIGSLGADTPCPTCERPLAGHLQQITAHTQHAAQQADDQVAAALAAEGQAAQRLVEVQHRQRAFAEAQRRRERLAIEHAAAQRRVADLQQRVAETRAQLPPPAPAPHNIDQLRVEVAAAQQAHDDLQRHSAWAERVPALQELLDRARAAQSTADRELEAAAAQLAAVADPGPQLTTARGALLSVQQAERSAERGVQDVHREIVAGEVALHHAQSVAVEQRRVAHEVAAVQGEVREWTALTDGQKGLLERFRDHVVDRIGPAVQAEASRLLAGFTGGKYSEVLLDTQYNVYVTDGGVPYALDRFSGGEQDLAHLALRLAVSRLVAERSGGAEVRFLALDEVFGSLDAQRRDHVVGALRGLEGLYSQVLVVSHQEALQEALDQAIVVDTDGAGPVTRIQNG